MTLYKKLLSGLLLCTAAYSLHTPVFAAEAPITILYTNDIHTYIANNIGDGNENGLTYSKLASLRGSTDNALLVDAGDHIQGTAYGGMDDGATIIKLMNAAGYDLATLGNHEFDYGMQRCLQVIEDANYPYVSCNFRHEADSVSGKTVLDSYRIFESGGKKIALIGITTPETFTSSTPAYFQNEDGEYIYTISGGEDGSLLYNDVQTAIDSAEAEGADYVIAVGHLGVDDSSSPWTSKDVIANTEGLDAFIDGHSHTTLEMEAVSDKNGEPVVLTQTGSYLNAVGKMTIAADGTVTTELLEGDELADIAPDPEVAALENAWIAEIDAQLGGVIGYAEVTLDNFDADGNRLVRKQETNTGDFTADALYYLFEEMGIDVDAAIMNGGGVRNTAITGELTYLSCKDIHTFGNVACLQTITGQQLLDALEWGCSALTADGSTETGSFLHVSGIRFTLDLTIPSTVQKDEKGIWAGSPAGEYRVKDVEVLNNETGVYEPLDLTAEYNLAGYNYTLRELGDGFAMFGDAVNILDYVAEDYMVLANYIQSFPVNEETGLPTITADDGYSNVYGSGRITIITEEPAAANEKITAGEVYTVEEGDTLWKLAQKNYGTGTKWGMIYEANRDTINDPKMIFADQILVLPAA